MTEPEPVAETDFDAYVDNQLDLAGRARVENHLAHNPAAAARVMADLHMRSALKLAFADPPATDRAETREAARRLGSALNGQQMWSGLRRAAAILLFVSAGWLANNAFNPFGPREVNASTHPPDFVSQAVDAHRTQEIRQGMASQKLAGTFDPEEIRSATGIVLPELPKGWRVAEAEVFPSSFGPSVEAVLVGEDSRRLSLFAVRPGHFAVEPVSATALGEAQAAWWQIGDVAYAVVSSDRDPGLREKAETLKSTLY
ncbi:anti-sigma factor family protein [Gellertiella hungarica]|uniref:Anti-sigma factor RsiW n=1 Tax=Gellertiella hungarica TaxID=1572859 RepID=A0A7W6NM45_9HYPH|nr:anti-sigma factor [Gellertiella hungarica]MBB4066100.1 anti-sigma factor RsiW [Gellertiella hungarica]